MQITVPQMALTALVLSFCAASTMAMAEIHRCKDESGQTVMSDRPCGAAYSGPALQSSGIGNGADRLAVPEMHRMRADAAGQYDFIPDRSAHSADRHSEKQALK